MDILYALVPIALILAASAVGAFIWAVRHGQFDDVHTPAVRILFEDEDGGSTGNEGGVRQKDDVLLDNEN